MKPPQPHHTTGSILMVEDDPDLAASMEMILTDEGHTITLSHNGREALDIANNENFDAIMTDFRLPGMGGMDLLTALREKQPQRPVILMTAHGNSELAIEAIKRGAFDYLLKPCDVDELITIAAKAVQAGKATSHHHTTPKPITPSASGLLGKSRLMQNVFKDIGRVATTDATTLILGETGTGKELVARAIHQHSTRKKQPFIAVNCGAIPENLLESELFGHIRGSFTGATRDRIGRFEQAQNGTLFLDEIGDLPMPVQVKLLRVLQERKIQPLGSIHDISVDVRIIAATHQPLTQLIEQKQFREDLYYRINTAIINLPPLRKRENDIQDLIQHFITEAATEYQLTPPKLTPPTLNRLTKHPWPGNVRELRNAMRQMMLRSRGFEITTELLDSILQNTTTPTNPNSFSHLIQQPIFHALEQTRKNGQGELHRELISILEQQLISGALELSNSHLGQVCNWLGISRVTLRKKMLEHGLDKP